VYCSHSAVFGKNRLCVDNPIEIHDSNSEAKNVTETETHDEYDNEVNGDSDHNDDDRINKILEMLDITINMLHNLKEQLLQHN